MGMHDHSLASPWMSIDPGFEAGSRASEWGRFQLEAYEWVLESALAGKEPILRSIDHAARSCSASDGPGSARTRLLQAAACTFASLVCVLPVRPSKIL